jgi:hypothetical protein
MCRFGRLEIQFTDKGEDETNQLLSQARNEKVNGPACLTDLSCHRQDLLNE